MASEKADLGATHMHATDNDAAKGAAAYTPFSLAFYDLAVLGLSNSFIWQCPTRLILDFYNEHISDKHLDVGVGTGYFLDRCQFPSTAPTVALLDLNPNSLAATAKRLRRYAPASHLGNVLEPINIGSSGFGSIGLNYLLHCVPGNLESKSIVFGHLKPLLKEGGVVFGSRSWAGTFRIIFWLGSLWGFTTQREFSAICRTALRILRRGSKRTSASTPFALRGVWHYSAPENSGSSRRTQF